MSASLVGSEMCIRDREGGSAVHVGTTSVGLLYPRRPRPPQHYKASLQTSVSYTHLTLPTICSV
eukprot:2997752-Alexandrium_andersonii.AAC.1